ncbi:hypothetical protein Leryth_008351 [Lithospermum erythrorhizon]|nr:hypothetical protein Leryth_008351 [Lithospermum erythrorhizon]
MANRALNLLRASTTVVPITTRRSSCLTPNIWSPRTVEVKQRRSTRSYSTSSLEPPDVSRLAETARISLSPEEVEEFGPKIRQVIDWFGKLQDVDLQSVEPAIRADTEGDNIRDDIPETFPNREAIIVAIPNFEDSYIKVPKVLNKE